MIHQLRKARIEGMVMLVIMALVLLFAERPTGPIGELLEMGVTVMFLVLGYMCLLLTLRIWERS